MTMATPTPAAEPQYDLVLKGGHVIDARNELSAVRDVALADGRVAAVAEAIGTHRGMVFARLERARSAHRRSLRPSGAAARLGEGEPLGELIYAS